MKNPIRKFTKWLKAKFTKVDSKGYSPKDESIFVVEEIKRLVNLPVLDAIVNFTPKGVDNIILTQVRLALNETITILNLADSCKDISSSEARLKCFIEKIKLTHEDDLGKVYKKIAAWYYKKRIETAGGLFLPLLTAEDEIQSRYDDLKIKGKV